ncbi:predicted protein [Aspergillus terreus NIH2624]|uniref:Uncharacterized protein n=1 Tax=Aspergillus terreus (strain NIH 2624 / FGSC A1156) TaxID=341663 RepID=Q0CIW6_ASPTN|nr:uncharacterized protein ATEG_06368 [Aspergillus terreus NIH2624]EAU32912.1 predicted protein [Aspergillus terreus NIH2624]
MSLALELCCRKTSDPELTGSSGHSMQQLSHAQKRRRQLENVAAEARTLVPPAAPELTPAQSARRTELRMELERRRPELRQIKENKKELQQCLKEINALLEARVREFQAVSARRTELWMEIEQRRQQLRQLREGSYRSARSRRLVHRAPAEPALPKEVLEKIRREVREKVYGICGICPPISVAFDTHDKKVGAIARDFSRSIESRELNLDIELDEPDPAAAEQTQEVKDQRASPKAEKRAPKAQILALEERKRRKTKKNKKPAAAAPAPRPAPAPAEPALPKEEFERIYHLAREQFYKELHLDIELDELAPAAAEPAQELIPGQRLYRDELLGRLQAVKGQKATFKAEKKAIREQIGALEQRIEWIDSAFKG